ncbi:hypothetical protein [Sphingobium bisphenolivorans]|uniref:hypothetical protein n=1 Tax=Sphingobium bisphenolivorans TaxID=1335760 RepID=UPI0003A8BF33|nr:hypothetical protein [Sphingobium bisphenolivorans]
MKITRLAAHRPLLLSTVLLLAACGRAEPVEDLPSQDQLAAAANAEAARAMAAAKAETPASRNYVNVERGFSITFPEGWRKDAAASTADGVVYQDPGAGADVRIFWQPSDGDKALREIVEAANAGAEGVSGDFIGDNEYRGTANDGEGNNVAIRLLKRADGSIVTASFVYPEMLSEQYQTMAERTLDSLKIFAPKAQTPDSDAAPAASNAAEAAR